MKPQDPARIEFNTTICRGCARQKVLTRYVSRYISATTACSPPAPAAGPTWCRSLPPRTGLRPPRAARRPDRSPPEVAAGGGRTSTPAPPLPRRAKRRRRNRHCDSARGRLEPLAGSPGRSSCAACSITISTAGRTGQLTGPVRITHPFHPRFGQKIDLVVHRVQWGEERVFYRDRRGHRASLPARWTSLAPEDPFLTAAAGRSRFRVQDLLELVALLRGLR